MKYCSECGKPLKTEVDYEKAIFTKEVVLIKKCKYCGNIVDRASIR